MAANLGIENLARTVQVDDESFNIGGGQAGEQKVLQEMQSQGMKLPEGSTGPDTVTFNKIFSESVSHVNQMQSQADTAIKELVAGRSKNIPETMLTIERADTSLKLMMQVRNKVLDAYREIMRMQV